jgi:hypothetical protein
MKLLAQILGLDASVAPQVPHVLFKAHPARPTTLLTALDLRTGKEITGRRIFLPRMLPRARVTSVSRPSANIPARTMDLSSDNIDAKWFVDKFVCPGNNYLPRTSGRDARVSPFSFSGMDLGNSFVLAQEDDYANPLVEVTP